MRRDIRHRLSQGIVSAKPNKANISQDTKEYKTVITFNQEDSAYNIYLTSEITEPNDYTNVFDTLLNAKDGDTVRFMLATPGGRLDTTNKIIGLAQITKARTVAVIGDVASAGTILALAFDDLVVLPNSEFMIHAASSGSWGKYHEILAGVKFWEGEMPKCFKEYYKDFLTPKEIEYVIKGNDLYFNSEEVERRWDLVLEARDKELAEDARLNFEETLEEYKQVLQNNGYVISKPRSVSLGTTKQPKVKPKKQVEEDYEPLISNGIAQ